MTWDRFLTYGDSQQNAFETFCNQLFERFLRRTYKEALVRFEVINGAGGDGGIEAYGELSSGDIIAVQAKWFRSPLKNTQINNLHNSVTTAKALRPKLKEYVICIPRKIGSKKYGKSKDGTGKKSIPKTEENIRDAFTEEMKVKYPDLDLTWWLENILQDELLYPENEPVQKYWFEKEVISSAYLLKHFKAQKLGWLHERYASDLHGKGIISKEYAKACFSEEYRGQLFKDVNKAVNEVAACLSLIDKFICIEPVDTAINAELKEVKQKLNLYLAELKNISTAVATGNEFYKSHNLPEEDFWKTKYKLEGLSPSDLQRNVHSRLVAALDEVYVYNLTDFIGKLANRLVQPIKLIFGEAGTGKTHGLANCVESHLSSQAPAVIIRAKGTPCKDWTAILSNALELNSWTKEEILSALETLAVRSDVQKATTQAAGKGSNREVTKAIICIDGLEEDIENRSGWYERIRQCEQLSTNYPRIRFLFTGREYFYNAAELPSFNPVFLPREGDVSVLELAPKYFSKEHYNIQIPSYSIIRGIDSPFALKLFCDLYKNRTIKNATEVITATRLLIRDKTDRLNTAFITLTKTQAGNTRNLIQDALTAIAEFFYQAVSIEHSELTEIISKSVNGYLTLPQIDTLIDYLTENGFLVRYEQIDEDDLLQRKQYFYGITYQSLIEHIISENIYQKIKGGLLDEIPSVLHRPMRRAMGTGNLQANPNQQIIQNIVNNLLAETGKLIGENGFLSKGFDPYGLKVLQLTALSKAPSEIASKFKSKVDTLFFSGYGNAVLVLRYLIIPSCNADEPVFGGEYLHEKLVSLPSAFDRDKRWSGLDMFEANKLGIEDKELYSQLQNRGIIFQIKSNLPNLSETDPYNQQPLVCAWALSSINQKFRSDLRVGLTGWAIKNPEGFIQLLTTIFNCNDPQIQEDLASVMLGVASRLKDKNSLQALARWSLTNVFQNRHRYRNVIVRQGFRAVVEKAYQAKVIKHAEVKQSRPKVERVIDILPIQRNIKLTGQGECYPLVYDLAWYAVEKSYKHFLKAPSHWGNYLKDNNCKEARSLLKKYQEKYKENDLYAGRWGMSVIIKYIRNLGFNRTVGNGHTEATHGSKSKVFTYEEKYTWLAVHYIQGYLADYIPISKRGWQDKRSFVKDYTQLSHIPNPIESLVDLDEAEKLIEAKDWVIKETLSKEFDSIDKPAKQIKAWVKEEPVIHFDKWLYFNGLDFNRVPPHTRWLALYNSTSIHESKKIGYTNLELVACLIDKNDLELLKRVVESESDSLHFLTSIDGLHSLPQSEFYSNPTDIVWMNWIAEEETDEIFYDESDTEHKLSHSIVEVNQNNLERESCFKLPSKKLRELIGCYELVGNELKDANGKLLAFVHKVAENESYEDQEIVLVDRELLDRKLREKNYEVVWFAGLFKRKNVHNETYKQLTHCQRTRKYFIYPENGQLQSLKFWDEYFSNG